MRIIAFIAEGPAIRAVLGHPGVPTAPPTLKPARAPPLWQMPGSEPGDIDPRAHPAPDHEFDQRSAWQGETTNASRSSGTHWSAIQPKL